MLTNASTQVSVNNDPASSVDGLIGTLICIRREWESAADGQSLLHHQGSVGLLLFDIVTKLEVSIELQHRILGSDLFEEATEFCNKSVLNRLALDMPAPSYPYASLV